VFFFWRDCAGIILSENHAVKKGEKKQGLFNFQQEPSGVRDDEGPIPGYSSVIGSTGFTAEILFLPRIDGAFLPWLTYTGIK
jgi:hypothetical protein